MLTASSSLASCALLALLLPAASRTVQDDEMGWTGVLDEASFAALHELREGEAPALTGEEIEIEGTRAYLSVPAQGEPIGAVVVIHEWWGLNEHVKHWADRLASDGYTALAVDLYGGVVATTREEAMASMGAVDDEAALATLRAAHAYLVDEEDAERTACIGWCFGGGWSLKLAMAEPELDAAVIYYGRLVTDVDALAAIEAPVLGIFGEQDSGIPPSAVAEFSDAMEKAGVDLTLRSYDAEHAFANPSSARYDAEHAGAAWAETRAFLCKSLWPEIPEGSIAAGTRVLEVTAPDGWEAQPPRPMRSVSFEVDASTECYAMALRGDGGGVAPNLNRWRQQMGEDSLDDDELEALPRVPMLGRMAITIRVAGSYTGMSGESYPDALLLGAICELDGETVFVKMIGPRNEVEAAEASFAPFCRGLR